MAKRWKLLLAACLLLFLSGCSGSPLPEGMEEEQVLNRGREIVQQLNDGQWQDIYDAMRSDGQETTSPEGIQTYMEEVLAEAGAYQRETDQMATGQKLQETGEKYATAVFYTKHEKEDILYRIAFSTSMELIGFQAVIR